VLQVNILLLNYSKNVFHIKNLELIDPKFMVVFSSSLATLNIIIFEVKSMN